MQDFGVAVITVSGEDIVDQRRYISAVVQDQIRYGLPRTIGVNVKFRF